MLQKGMKDERISTILERGNPRVRNKLLLQTLKPKTDFLISYLGLYLMEQNMSIGISYLEEPTWNQISFWNVTEEKSILHSI